MNLQQLRFTLILFTLLLLGLIISETIVVHQRDRAQEQVTILQDSCTRLRKIQHETADPFSIADTVIIANGGVFAAKKVGWVSPANGWSTSGNLNNK